MQWHFPIFCEHIIKWCIFLVYVVMHIINSKIMNKTKVLQTQLQLLIIKIKIIKNKLRWQLLPYKWKTTTIMSVPLSWFNRIAVRNQYCSIRCGLSRYWIVALLAQNGLLTNNWELGTASTINEAHGLTVTCFFFNSNGYTFL